MKKFILIVLITVSSGVSLFVNAVPANPTPVCIVQPNGTSLTIRLVGDEVLSYNTTIDGYIIKKNSVGIYEYVNILNNIPILSGIIAHDVDDRNSQEIAFLKYLREEKVCERYATIMLDRANNFFDFTLPNQNQLRIKHFNNENGVYTTTEDNLLIEKNEQGYYEYVIYNSQYSLSGVIANNIESRSNEETAFVKTLKAKNTRGYLLNKMSENKRMLRATPNKGDINVLVILMEFPNKGMEYGRDEFYRQLNSKNYKGIGSAKDFFLENSYGQLSMNFTVVGPYMADKNFEHYGKNIDENNRDVNIRDLVSEAVKKSNNDIDCSVFDNNKDNIVDFVHIIYAGYAESYYGADPNTIWPHQGTMSWLWGILNLVDGKRVSKYSCSSELEWTSGSNMAGIGTLCHEIGHILGAPDFYDRNRDSDGDYRGTGDWDLMAHGNYNGGGHRPAHFNPFVKTQIFGWAELKDLPDEGALVLKPVSTPAGQGSFYRLPTPTPDEYFILENRQQLGFDQALPGHGLMIYHTHSHMKGIAYHADYINIRHPQLFYPVAANAQANPHVPPHSYGWINGSSTPFPNNNKDSFTPTTIPSAVAWDGGHALKSLYFIREIGNDISLIVDRPAIKGSNDIVCKEELYSIDGLPDDYVVKWSFSTPNSDDNIIMLSGEGELNAEPNTEQAIPMGPPMYLFSPLYITQPTSSTHLVKVTRGEVLCGEVPIITPIPPYFQDNGPSPFYCKYSGSATLRASIVSPSGHTVRIRKEIEHVGDVHQSIVVCNSNGEQLITPYITNTDYRIEARSVPKPWLNGAIFEWEIVNENQPSNIVKKQGRSFSFKVNKIPGKNPQYVWMRVRYQSPQCGESKWFYKRLIFQDNHYSQYALSFTNPAYGFTNISVFETQNTNIENSSLRHNLPLQEQSMPYQGSYTIELWNDYTRLKTVDYHIPTAQLSLNGLPPGIYYLRLIIDNVIVKTEQLIVR